MQTIEIYDKETGEIVDTQEIDDIKDFLAYWYSQADTKEFGYRVKQDRPQP
jgi:hypothetical protein